MNDEAERRTFAYDEVAYPSPLVGAATPERLRAAALLHGYAAPDVATARVLEIGCGDGINLLAFAAVAPESKSVGFDLSHGAIQRGRSLLGRAGLENVELHVGDILTYPRDGERFDYITCHGVYSWVPQMVRGPILELIAARLKPGGVAYLSFDCLPAAAAKLAIVRFLRSQLAPGASLEQAVTDAAGALALLNQNQRRDSSLRAQLKTVIEALPGFQPGYFYHDWLAEHYDPVDLHEFLPALAEKGLAFAGSANNYDLYVTDMDEEARRVIDARGSDWGQRLLALSALHGGQIFQRALIVQSAAPPPAVSDGLRALSFAFLGSRREEMGEDGPVIHFERNAGNSVKTSDADLNAVLDCLHAVSPAEVSYERLRERSGVETAALDTLLGGLCATSLVAAHASPQPFTLTPGEHPRAGLMVRTMLATCDYAAGLRGSKIQAEAAPTRYCLTLCDGTRTRAEIAAAMSDRFGSVISEGMVAGAIAQFAGQRVFEA